MVRAATMSKILRSKYRGARRCARGDDGVMIAHLALLKTRFVGLIHPLRSAFSACGGQRLVVEAGHDLAHWPRLSPADNANRCADRSALMLLVKGLRAIWSVRRALKLKRPFLSRCSV